MSSRMNKSKVLLSLVAALMATANTLFSILMFQGVHGRLGRDFDMEAVRSASGPSALIAALTLLLVIMVVGPEPTPQSRV